MSFATSREEFTFSDSELSGEAEDEDDEEVLLDEDEKEDEEDYYAILGVPRNVSSRISSAVGFVLTHWFKSSVIGY